jgi:hypothetical protein
MNHETNDKSDDPLSDAQITDRNDPAIDPGSDIAGTEESLKTDPGDQASTADPKVKRETNSMAVENDYSPDFKSELEKKPKTDADVNTDGG